jgi:hypothetical protein
MRSFYKRKLIFNIYSVLVDHYILFLKLIENLRNLMFTGSHGSMLIKFDFC